MVDHTFYETINKSNSSGAQSSTLGNGQSNQNLPLWPPPLQSPRKDNNTRSNEPQGIEAHFHIRTQRPIKPNAIRQYLRESGSPLEPYAEIIVQSDYGASIVGICTIEQNRCKKAPNWNYWGLKAGKGERSDKNGFLAFDTAEEAIAAVEARLKKYEQWWGPDIRNWVGPKRYCASACTNWVKVVSETKLKLENYD